MRVTQPFPAPSPAPARAPATLAVSPPSWAKRWLLPTLTDVFFIALVLWIFASGPMGWTALLADGDTGWHIRTGEFVLDHGYVPDHDLFSFSKSGETWYAWEWLSDVIFALLHRQWGLKAITLLAGVLIIASVAILLAHMIWRGANFFYRAAAGPAGRGRLVHSLPGPAPCLYPFPAAHLSVGARP